jgi:hypothetical protein
LSACGDSSELIGDQASSNLHLGISRALRIFLRCPFRPDGKKVIAADADETAHEHPDQADNRQRQLLTRPLASRNVRPFRHDCFLYAWSQETAALPVFDSVYVSLMGRPSRFR